MKPLKLSMHYFGPYENEEVDFQLFEEVPFFLISGDTGAGKSTIFDAMTFALFNQTTNDRKVEEMRSDYATPKDWTEVTFYFEEGNQIYKIVRSPQQETAKKRGEGTTNSAPKASLSVVAEVGGAEIENLASKPVDVATEIDELLQLSADQFKKIILLPQNDFSQFLKSETKDKEAVLKKIFGTQVFTDFTNKIKEHYDAAKNKNNEFETKLQEIFSANIWTEEELSKFENFPEGEKFVLLNEFIKNRLEKEEETKEDTKKKEVTYSQMDTTFLKGKDLEQQFLQLEKKENAYGQLVQQEADITKKGKEIEELEWVQTLENNVSEVTRLKSEKESLETKTEELRKISEEEENNLKKNTVILEHLIKKDSEMKQHQKRLEELAVLINKNEEAEKNQKILISKTQEKEKTEAHLKDQQEKQESLAKEIKTLESQLTYEEALLEEKNNLHQLQLKFTKEILPSHQTFEKATSDLGQENHKLEKANEKLAATILKEMKAKDTFDSIKKRRQDLMIAQLQSELVEGEPCLVCGSKEHPQHHSNIKADETALKLAMDEIDAAQETYAKLNEAHLHEKKEVEQLETDLAKLKEVVTKAGVSFHNASQEFMDDAIFKDGLDLSFEEVENFLEEKLRNNSLEFTKNEDIKKEIQQKEEKKNLAKESATEIEKQLVQITEVLHHATNELEQFHQKYGDVVPTGQLKDEQLDLTKNIQKYNDDFKLATDEKQKAEVSFEKSKTNLENHLLQKDETNTKYEKESLLLKEKIKDKELDYILAKLQEIQEGKLKDLQNQVTTYYTQKDTLKRAIKEEKESLKGKEKPNLTELEEKKELAKKIYLEATKYFTLLQEETKQAESYGKKAKDLQEEQGQFNKNYLEIAKLYDTVNGKNSADKLKLETYVVQNYLQKVLEYANRHFIQNLSNHRYSFVLAETARDKRSDRGLDINIYDNETGKERSTKTLSGGETFIAALSIALSLSEVVQSNTKGVQIEALFVDEGFGTLDQETLEKAMEALESIGENRLVGVISHVEEMKTRIGYQLEIKKKTGGQSVIKTKFI